MFSVRIKKALLKQFKELKAKEKKEAEIKEIKESVIADVKKELKEVKVETKVQNNKEVESKELTEFKEAVKMESKMSLDAQFKIAGKICKIIIATQPGSRGVYLNRFLDFARNDKVVSVKTIRIHLHITLSSIKD